MNYFFIGTIEDDISLILCTKLSQIGKWTERGSGISQPRIQFHFHSLFMLTTLPHLSLATVLEISSGSNLNIIRDNHQEVQDILGQSSDKYQST